MYSNYNEEKSVIAERIIRILKNNIHKYMASVSKHAHIDKLYNIANGYNNKHQSTIKMKPVDIKSNRYTDSNKEIKNKDPEFKNGDIVKISKYKNIFAKGYTPNQPEEVLWLKSSKYCAMDTCY